MPDTLTMRFGVGKTEFRVSEKAPEVGDVLQRDGDDWIVVSVEEAQDGTAIVTLRPQVKSA